MVDKFGEVDPTALEQQLRRFCETYYAELRQRMAQYPAASEVFPYYLTGFRRIVAILTKDGVVIIHWLAEHDSWEFQVSSNQRVTDITEDLATVFPNGYRAVVLPRDHADPEKDFDGVVTVMAPEPHYNGRVIRPGWLRLDAAGAQNLDRDLYSEERARDEATKDVLLAANAFLMGLAQLPPDRQEDRVLAELEAAINEFEQLLATDPEEPKLQIFLGLSRNKILLDPSARTVTPEVKLGSEHRVDFVLELPQKDTCWSR